MKKRKSKKTKKDIKTPIKIGITLVIILIIALIIAIILTVYFIIKINNQNQELKEFIEKQDIIAYNLIRCTSDCPLQFDENQNQKIPIKICAELCRKAFTILEEYQTIKSGTLLRDQDLKKCITILPEQKDYELYNNCIKELLPKLQEKYPHTKQRIEPYTHELL